MPKNRIVIVLSFLLFMMHGVCHAQQQNILLRPGVKTVADLVIEEAQKYLGIPYKWGGSSPKGFDCAGFTRFIYAKFGVELARSAAPQYKLGKPLKTDEIRKGDLVFYGGRHNSKSIGHVGIVVDVNSDGFTFIHSATSTGISISRSSEPYYRSRYIGACRVVDKVTSNMPANDDDRQGTVPVYRKVPFVESPYFSFNISADAN